jgi:hypothetical protein
VEVGSSGGWFRPLLLRKPKLLLWWGGPLLLEEGEAKGQQLRDDRLWLPLGLRGRVSFGFFFF